MIPEGWRISWLSDRNIRVIDGDRGKNYPSAGEFFDAGHCLFLSAKNVTKDGFSFDETQFVTKEKHETLRKGELSRGDIVFTTRGTVGNVAFYDKTVPFDVIRINSGMVMVRNEDADVSNVYLKLLFRSFVVQNQVRRLTFGSAQPQLTVGIINCFDLPLPPLPEQRKIADILSTWDCAIETVEALIAGAHAQKQALMQQLLPQGATPPKKRLPGFSGEWRKMKLGGMAKIVMGSSPPSSAYNETEIGLPLIQGNADIKNRQSAPRVHTSKITQVCEPKDILFSVRAPVGEISIAIHHACIGRGIAAIRPHSGSDADFLYFCLLAAESRWARLSQGSTFQAVNSKDLRGSIVFAPSKETEREAIGAAVRESQSAKDNLQYQLAALRREKAALMQQLLTGKRRVKLPESEVA